MSSSSIASASTRQAPPCIASIKEKEDAEKAPAEAPRPQLYVSLMDTMPPVARSCSTSIFEAKGGVRPALLAISNVGDVNRVCEAPAMKACL